MRYEYIYFKNKLIYLFDMICKLPIFISFIILTLIIYVTMYSRHIEASAQGAPITIGCYSDGSIFNTATDGNGGRLYFPPATDDLRWEFLLPSTPDYINAPMPGLQPPPTTGTWAIAKLVTAPDPLWYIPPLTDAGWIAHDYTGAHPGLWDIFYRYRFYLDDRVDVADLSVNMFFYSDNSVYDIWVNDTSQGVSSYGPYDPYNAGGFYLGNAATGALTGPWKKGAGQLNEIIVHVKSRESKQGFLAQFQPTPLCKPRLTLQTVVNNNDGGTNIAADFTLFASGSSHSITGRSGEAAVTNHAMLGDTYALSQTAIPGYQQDIQCTVERVDPGGGPSTNITMTGPNITFQSGDKAVCIFTNTYIPATLTLAKNVLNSSIGNKTASDFVLSAAGPTPITGPSGSPAVTNAKVDLGTYTLSEQQLPGYTMSGAYVCNINGSTSQGNSITLNSGDNAICTITNIDQGAELTLLKTVINDDGGTAAAADFVLRAEGPIIVEGPQGSSTVTNGMVPLGIYTLSETGAPGYGGSQFTCTINGSAQTPDNTVKLENNGDKAVCTVTNNDIKITKALVEESGLIPGVAEKDEILTYEVTLMNEEQSPTTYDLVDQLDAATTYVSGSTSGSGEPESTRPIVWRGVAVPGAGQVTIRYQVKVTELPTDRDRIINCVASTRCVETVASGRIELKKSLLQEVGGIHENVAESGETLTYEIELKNVGSGSTVYTLGDSGSTYLTYVPGSTRGTAGAGEPEGQSPLVWKDLIVAAGGTVTVVYDMKVGDLPLSVTQIDNIAYDPELYKSENGTYNLPPADFCSLYPQNCAVAETMNISLTKEAQNPQILRGQPVQFLVSLRNNSNATIRNLTVKDVFPVGFRYITNSASMNGVPVETEAEGRVLHFQIPEIGPKEETKILVSFQTLAAIGTGDHINVAEAWDANGQPVAANANAKVEVMIETQFDCSEILGKVFDDRNRNGYQDQGEIGVPGVRVTSVSGISITTDRHGRFSVPCADLPRQRTGTNFILKLDPRSLPAGYRILSENPRTVRLTAGKATHINFATSISRVVRVDVNDEAFQPDSLELMPEWYRKVHEVILVLESEPSVLRLAYIGRGETQLARKRIHNLRQLIGDLWRDKLNRYRLEIETNVMVSLQDDVQ